MVMNDELRKEITFVGIWKGWEKPRNPQ